MPAIIALISVPIKLDLQQYILDSADKFQSTLEDEISSLDQTCFELQKQ